MPDETLPAHPASPPPDLPNYIDRYVAGESVQDIAAAEGVSRNTIYVRMAKLTHSGKYDKAYTDIVTDALIAKMALADEKLANAVTKEDIARAREECRFARMDLERRRPALYGPKQEYTSEKIVVHVHRRADEGQNTQTIDVTPQEDSDAH